MTDLVAPAAAQYAEDHTTAPVGALAEVAAWTQANTSAPQMMSGVPEARLLEALIVAGGARHVLEVGTFTGYGALAMAGALPPDGRVTTIEVDEANAAVARRHIDASPHADRVHLIVADALRTIAGLEGPFDLVYIDAWKSDYPAYYDADNLFRAGRAFDPTVDDESTTGIREFARRVQEDDRVHNVLLTVGEGRGLGWDAADVG